MGIIKNYEAPKPVNPYAADVAQMEIGDAYEIEARTTAPEGERGSIVGEKAKFQAAAREAGYSARESEREDHPDGITRIVVVLTEKVERKANKEKGVADAE